MSISEMDAFAGEEYAGFWRRFLAAALDNVSWVFFYLWIYVWVVGGALLASDAAGIAAVVVFFSLWFNYFAFCEWRWGQTMGKNATGIAVRSFEGVMRGRAARRDPFHGADPSDVGAERLTYGQASIRNLLRLIDFFLIGELMIVTTARKQRLGDKAAKTVVVRCASRWAGQEAT